MKTAITIGNPRGLHRGRCVAEILKHSGFPVLVHHVVSLKHNSPLKFAARVPIWEVRILLDNESKKHTHVNLVTVPTRFSSNVGPFTNGALIPSHPSAKAVPLLIDGSLGGWSAVNLLLI
jgi:hypothetical protein